MSDLVLILQRYSVRFIGERLRINRGEYIYFCHFLKSFRQIGLVENIERIECIESSECVVFVKPNRLFLSELPDSILILFMTNWLSFGEFATLDTSICNRNARSLFLAVTQRQPTVFPKCTGNLRDTKTVIDCS